MSEIQKSVSNKRFLIFDIDNKDESALHRCIDLVDGYCDVVETRGGYHIFVHRNRVDDITDKMWYPKMMEHVDQKGDIMSCPVGTYQGGFTPNFFHRMR